MIGSITKAREASIKTHRFTRNYVSKLEMDRRKLDKLISDLPEIPKALQEELSKEEV